MSSSQERRIRFRSERRPCATSRAPAFAVSLAVACLFACSHQRDPQTAFDHARQTYRHGDIVAAGKEADQGFEDFHKRSTEWAWRFVILRARALHRRGMESEAMKLLSSQPTPPASIESAVQKERLESDIYATLRNFPEAEQKLTQAERICGASDSSVCGDLTGARGWFEMERGRYSAAQTFFERALVSARAHDDKFLEAIALLNLSYSANEQTHFDEALDWANSALEISITQDFAGIAQTASANMAWAYYRLGDLEKAQGMF